MPKREGEPRVEEAVKRPSRGATAPVKQAEAKAEAVDTKKKVVQKSILEERVKKFVAEVSPTLLEKMSDIFERSIMDNETKEKANVVFTAFSPNGSEDEVVDDAFNVEAIKDILFHYHTMPEKEKSGKVLVVEVVPPINAQDPHLVCFHELS